MMKEKYLWDKELQNGKWTNKWQKDEVFLFFGRSDSVKNWKESHLVEDVIKKASVLCNKRDKLSYVYKYIIYLNHVHNISYISHM